MLNYKLKIGLVPERRWLADAATRKGIFAPKYAVANKEKVISYIKEHFADEDTEFTDLEWLNDEGLLHENGDCEKVRDYLLEQKVDAIFIINCNFGNEEAAGQIAKMMNLPTLLWGPQDVDFEDDGTRHTDAQCGLFAISKQLHRYKVPFTYIENCPVDSELFADGIKKFFSVATIVKNFKNLKAMQVGTRLNPFKSVMANELELTEKFGMNMQTMNMAVAANKIEKILAERKDELKHDLAELKKMYYTEHDNTSDENLIKMMALVHFYKEVFEESGADVLTSECWTAFPAAVGVSPCLSMSLLYDMGYIVTCESDVCGAISQAILMCASRGKKPPLFGEFTCKNPDDKNSELLWHCGPFPYSAWGGEGKAEFMAGKPKFRVKDGTYTLARFQGGDGKYKLLGGSFETTDGPETTGTYIWAKFKDLSKIEKKLINGPYIHHMSEVYGDYSDVLEEFCKYIPGLEFDPLED